MKCPCCGTEVPDKRLLVCLDDNTLHFQGNIYPVRWAQIAEIIHALAQVYPKARTNRSIIDHVWGHRACENVNSALRVQISHARRELRPLGARIVNDYGSYRLVLPP